MNSSIESVIEKKPLNDEKPIIAIDIPRLKPNKLYCNNFTYQCQKPKEILNPYGIYIDINCDGSIEYNLLNKSQVKMLNLGENIVLVKPINLNKSKYLKEIHNINGEITNGEITNGENKKFN